MKLTTNSIKTHFVIECTFAEYSSAKSAGLAFTGFRWNKETRQWASPHVVAASNFLAAYKEHTGNECELTDSGLCLYQSELKRTKNHPVCRRCAGTGQFITMVLNGRPTGPGGECFRCNGKGYQSARDEQRNDHYDELAAVRAVHEMMA